MAYDPNSPLPDDQAGLLVAILSELKQLNANAGIVDPANKRLQVTVLTNASLPANQSTNIAQWGGQTAAINAGAAGNGVPRVTPSNDTLAGIPSVYMLQQAWYNTPLINLYTNIATS